VAFSVILSPSTYAVTSLLSILGPEDNCRSSTSVKSHLVAYDLRIR